MMCDSKQEFAENVVDTLKRLEDEGLTITKNYIVTYFKIMENPKRNLTEIRKELDISQATMWRIIDKFEELDLGKKVQDSFDHHVYYFKPYKQGEDLIVVEN